MPPANKRGADFTHELLVIVLDPEHGPYNAATASPETLQHLTPVNIAEQFTTTDDQARTLTQLCARACVDGALTPENGDAPDRIRAHWRSTIRQTLDHDHDPHHGRLGHAQKEH